MNPVNRRPQRVVFKQDLDRFTNDVVSLHALDRETGIHFKELLDVLSLSGVSPAFEPDKVHATFYDRRAVSGVIGPL